MAAAAADAVALALGWECQGRMTVVGYRLLLPLSFDRHHRQGRIWLKCGLTKPISYELFGTVALA